jgi:hypothetical protein
MVKPSQCSLRLLELHFRQFDGYLAILQTFLVIRFFLRAGLVFVRAEMLDLLARVFDFGEAESGRGTFQEMAKA